MRVQDIRIGETYQVKVHQRLPQALHTRYPRTRTEFAADMRLQQHRGDRFDLTVTDIAPETATVDGYEATTSRVTLRLTAEQAEFLELPAGPEYEIDGFITDADGNEAILAATVTYAGLPATWLCPLEEPVRIAPSTARFYRARVQAQATGMAAQDITRRCGRQGTPARRRWTGTGQLPGRAMATHRRSPAPGMAPDLGTHDRHHKKDLHPEERPGGHSRMTPTSRIHAQRSAPPL
ncbi:hypothetical protein SLV14_000213 [Streptomyces sp. Je 1-4]|uniref:hypothetical protein n=1 Tax=Streptomyces TaxID=1883 RepID=UPI0021DB480B|nr:MULTISPECIES: hypothetical protein [unclassified Streptomyces]UYB37914.1 hypothetical protein SLV14_000213 [Streptomyces sp. Je 1-4]UZQ33841.1 hypothetical protein SLV14N_000213 [Streptomyces sp. Je 1-4] [Streptomyces sp. Je 1-4 4N24]UZQ41259.1 hypothetical protein SLV14NA_000213 [Streptomyces sp. Je 1-4] [Streptomyces sp. Je 1-4 4N24_ara]